MADRIQYPMLPNYSPALMHQQQQVQQQSQQIPAQQQQQQSQDSHSSGHNPRMWQNMQQMRSHPTDLSSVQSGSQLADLFRNPSMIRLQQGQPQSQPHQFSSGIGMPQMAANQGINGPQQSFQDLSTNQPQPSHMPSVNLNGMSNSNVHMNSAPQSLQSRNTLMQNFNRPYDLGFSQNQHPQNGPVGFNNKQGLPPQASIQQQARDHQHMQSGNHAPPTDIFSSPNMQADAMRRPSPSHASMPLQHMQNGAVASATQHNPSVAQNSMNLFNSRPLPDQVLYLRNAIRTLDNNIGAHKASLSDGDSMTKARVLAALMSKREAMNKLLLSVLATLQAQNGAGQGQVPWMLHQHQQQQQGPSQPSFDPMSMPRTALGIQATSSLPQNQIQHQPSSANVNPGTLVQPSQSSQAVAQNSLPLQPNAPSLLANHVNATGTTFPAQTPVPSNPTSFNVPPGLSQQLSSQQPQMQRATAQPTTMHNAILQMIPPLDKTRFDLAFKNFCNNKQVKIDQRSLIINNGSIDLHMLHTLVMREGGETKVHQRDLWSIIGGRMGYVQFPGTDTEPAKSGPGIAQQLEHIYRQYLANFDRAYIANVLDSRIKNNPGTLPSNASQLNLMISMADQTTTQLKMRGFNEQAIQFMEAHRPHLQRMRLERDGFHDAVKPSIGDQGAPIQVNANGAIPPMNQLSGSRQVPFVQSVPQNNAPHVSGHPTEARQQLTHQMSSNSTANRPGGREQVQAILLLIAKARQDTITSNANRPLVTIPAEQRNEFNTLIEQIHRQAAEIENKLPMLYIYTRKEDLVRRIAIISVTVQQQRSMMSSSSPRFFVTLENLRMMHQQMQQATEMCSQLFTALSQQRSLQQQQPQSVPRQVNARSPFPLDSIRTPAQLQPSPSLQPQQQTGLQQSSPSQMPLLQPPPQKRKPASQTMSTPSPVPTSVHTPGPSVPSASTPLNNTPSTPALPSSSSPPAPRSPKGKIPAKVKQTPAPTPKRRPSKTVPPASHAESPATPSSNTSAKRRREEDDNAVEAEGPSSASHTINVSNEPSPPKRPKTEWENPPNEELKKRTEGTVKLESVEDANTFLEQVSELLKNAGGNGGQESTLTADLSETLGMILKGCTTVPEASDNSLAFSEARESPPASGGFKDAFEEFIDYSFGLQEGQLDDEEGSKAHTPDLMPSSTNLSPESNTDGESSLLATSMTSVSDFKREDHQDLRLGLWKELDGGESAYYQPYEWKWDSPMPVLEQSWAVSTS